MNAQAVTFAKLGALKSGDKFVIDFEDACEPAEYLQFLSFAYDGAAMVSAANTDFVRGFKTGLDRHADIVKIGH